MIGQTIDNYRILEVLGSGGMSVVYRAEDLKLGRHVALKFFPPDYTPDTEALVRFEREARAASALNHPNICTIYGIHEHEGRPFLALELLEGQTLRDRIGENPLPPAQLLDWAIQVTDALEFAHQHGIIHRDIKPSNIFITWRNQAKILDFGLAKMQPKSVTPGGWKESTTDSALTRPGEAVGTVQYMSPEQASGIDLDARTDIYSFGTVLYEMATGQPAFRGATTALIFHAILSGAVCPPQLMQPELPVSLAEVISRAMEKDRERRYRAAVSLRDALQRVQRELPTGAPSKQTVVHLQTAPQKSTRAASATRRRRWRRMRYVPWLAGSLIAVSALAAYSIYVTRPARFAESDAILLADIENRTGDPVFDGTVKQALAVKLGESPYLDVVPEPRVRETLRLMGRSPDERVSGEVAREACVRQGVKAMLSGEIAALGKDYVFSFEALDCRTGNTLARGQVEARKKEDVLRAVSTAAGSLRERLGESLASIQRSNQPLEEATTPSLEALQAFSQGVDRRDRGSELESIPYFKRAIELDPDFALAHARLGTVYEILGENSKSLEHREAAFALRDRVSERERFYISAHYYNSIARDTDQAIQTYEMWKRAYPRDALPYTNLGVIYSRRGDLGRALAQYQRALQLNPQDRRNYSNLGHALIRSGRFAEARSVFERRAALLGKSGGVSVNLWQLAFAEGDAAAMEKHAADTRGTPEEGDLLEVQASAAAFSGELDRSREFTRKLVNYRESKDFAESACAALAGQAEVEALFGNRSEARGFAELALATGKSGSTGFGAALALALAGETDFATRVLAERSKSPLGEGPFRRVSEEEARAALALARGAPKESIRLVERSSPPNARGSTRPLAVYLRGEALLKLRQPDEAAAEFQFILDHRGMVLLDPLYPLAQLGLARARALQGNAVDAREAYQALFRLWPRADDEAPLVRQARAEYAKLQ